MIINDDRASRKVPNIRVGF